MNVNIAVPKTGLLSGDSGETLALLTPSWRHLQTYLAIVKDFPECTNCPDSVTASLSAVRRAYQQFGTPGMLKLALQKQPALLTSDEMPEMVYAAITWLVHRLQTSAQAVVANVKTINGWTTIRDKEDVASRLHLFGEYSQDFLDGADMVRMALKQYAPTLINAQAKMAEAEKTETTRLHKLQEEAGGLQATASHLQEQIAKAGVFGAAKKKKLQEQLLDVTKQLELTSKKAEDLRRTTGSIEELSKEGLWLDSAMDDLVNYLDLQRKIWTTFASDVNQLIVDASDAQMRDLAWLKKTLALDDAALAWNRIAVAAEHFVEQSGDDPSPETTVRRQP